MAAADEPHPRTFIRTKLMTDKAAAPDRVPRFPKRAPLDVPSFVVSLSFSSSLFTSACVSSPCPLLSSPSLLTSTCTPPAHLGSIHPSHFPEAHSTLHSHGHPSSTIPSLPAAQAPPTQTSSPSHVASAAQVSSTHRSVTVSAQYASPKSPRHDPDLHSTLQSHGHPSSTAAALPAAHAPPTQTSSPSHVASASQVLGSHRSVAVTAQ
mmetsp:Transcript_21486/g.43401  ORF Transcript_21486/g.43401 Transcript_21486/m.43401 type:complete len:208 (-) Transcript_21486:15-638(-)